MSKKIMAQDEEIVIGVDVSDSANHAAVVRAARGELITEMKLKPDLEEWERLLRKLPGCRVTVVCEAGPQGYNLRDAVKLLGSEAVVIAPEKHIGVKTDRRDARAIAHDFLAGRAKAVTVPDLAKRSARQVMRLRGQFMKDIVRMSNRASGLIRFHGLVSRLVPWRRGGVDERLRLCLDELAAARDFLRERVKALDAELEKIAGEPRFRGDVEKLTRIKGIGVHTALEILLEVADIGSFKKSASFASYTGLCPGEWSTGNTRRQGHITRRGPGRLRGALVRSAWTLVRHDEEERLRFQTLAARAGKKRAIVATARRLAVRVWWTLREEEKKAA